MTRAGMEYLHIPVDPKNLDPSSAEAVAKAIAASDGPVYVHCAAGGRAVTHALLAEAKAQGSSADEVLKKAEAHRRPDHRRRLQRLRSHVAGDGKK